MSVEVHMLPIKAGDATLIITRSSGRPYTVLIDTGLANDEIVSYVQSQGIYHLDLVVLSHPDLDHLQGLLALIKNPLMTIGKIWCFDLRFLRDFVTTGKMPPPEQPTHLIDYQVCLRSITTHQDILKEASVRGIDAFQVSEGHQANLGNLHIEVLYPWDGFYNALRSPAKVKTLLSKKWPSDWVTSDKRREDSDREDTPRASKISKCEEKATLENLLKEINYNTDKELDKPLANPENNEEDRCQEELIGNNNEDIFPVSLLGTLYNNLSIVIKIHVLNDIYPISMLFPGDLTDWTYLIAKRLRGLQSHIFKYPHHGSAGLGIDRRSLKKYGFPFYEYCPCGPWCIDHCYHLHRDFWRRFEKVIHYSSNASELFSEFVKPKHTLIFPYPSQGLPKSGVITYGLGQIHSNRSNTDINKLADRSNPIAPRILRLGENSNQIKVV